MKHTHYIRKPHQGPITHGEFAKGEFTSWSEVLEVTKKGILEHNDASSDDDQLLTDDQFIESEARELNHDDYVFFCDSNQTLLFENEEDYLEALEQKGIKA